MLKHLRLILTVATLAWASAGGAADGNVEAGKYTTTQLAVAGAVENRLLLTVDDLKALPSREMGSLPIVCQSGATTSTIQSLKGVLLRDVLEKAVLVLKDHNDAKKMAVIATASDGYKVVFSWSEIFNSPLAEGILVFYERDGRPLDEAEGRIALISAKDTRTGPRHVKWLSGVEVRKIVD